MAYERINWQNEPIEATAINNINLNKMDNAIYELDGKATTTDTAIANLQSGKVDKVTGQGLSKTNDVQVTSSTNVGTEIATVQIFPSTGGVSGVQIKNGVVVDSALSSSSENPVQNKVVKSAIDGKSTVVISDTLATGTTLANITIDGTTTAIKGSDIEVDEELSPTSTNPVENKAIYDALNNLLPSKTVSGNPISISDASGFNAKALTVSMNPIQDLHGYPNPWVGGAGKNKFVPWNYTAGGLSWVNDNNKLTITVNTTNVYVMSKVFEKSLGEMEQEGIIVNGHTYTAKQNAENQGGLKLQLSNGAGGGVSDLLNGYTFTYNSSTMSAYTFVIRKYGDVTVGDVITFYPQLEEGSTATAWTPYENKCPISGRTEASVTRTAGEDEEIKTHTYSDAIYGGIDDFVNGGGSVTVYAHTFDGTETLTSPNEGYIRFIPQTTLLRNVSSIPRSSHYVGYYGALDNQPDNSVTLANTAIIQIRDTVNATTSDAYKAYLTQQYQNGTPLTITATLATPTTISTSAEEITLLKGNNVLSTNADDMELKYSVLLDSLLPTTTRTLAKSVAPIEEEPIVEEPKEETDETEEQR